MGDWIKAYWQYRKELAKLKTTIKIELDWFSIFFWGGVVFLILKESL